MSYWIQGWIEVSPSLETSDEHAWMGAIDLGAIIMHPDEDSERLFGLSKRCVSGEKSVQSLAGGRGLPANPSAHVNREMEEIAAHEAKFGKGELGGYTHALWAEIRGYSLTAPLEDRQWMLPFTFARSLEERFGADRVRFVVWYNW